MSTQRKRRLIPVAVIFYLVIGIEILYMISPFALYYYSSYGPSLNFLQSSPATAWLTHFFLPHYSETSSWLLNSLNPFGRILFLGGLALFLVGAGQIYYAKFRRKGAVTAGLYRVIRHPQYTAFALMGLGVLFVWPRFMVLVMYVIMLFVYFWLAKKEEKECDEKFGESYREYLAGTSMFLPGDVKIWRKLNGDKPMRQHRSIAKASFVIGAIVVAVLCGFGIRNIAISKLAIHKTTNAATLSVVQIEKDKLQKIFELAQSAPGVSEKLREAGRESGSGFLNYVVPNDWFLADLPLEVIPKGVHGHVNPKNYNRDEFKVLFTVAGFAGNSPELPDDILKRAVRRTPIVVVRLDLARAKILSVDEPPPHVLWGDIPTPTF